MYPTFLAIGAQKAGTTWLHENLRGHPRIWLPPVKEIHYFDHAPPRLRKRLFGKPGHLRAARAHLRAQLAAALRGGSLPELRWALRFCLAPRTDAWYRSLFPDAPDLIPGEVCPGYARLDAAAVAGVHRRMPDARIVYLLRDPIERAWSSAAMHFRKTGERRIEDVDDATLRAHVLREKTRLHDDYVGALEAWGACYPAERLFVGFFDDLARDPRSFLASVLQFLGAEVGEDVIPPEVGLRRNPGLGEEIPERHRRLFAELHIEPLRRLAERLDSPHTRRWLEHAERCLES